MGWSLKGVLRLEMVCRNKVDVDNDDMILKAPLELLDMASARRSQVSLAAEYDYAAAIAQIQAAVARKSRAGAAK